MGNGLRKAIEDEKWGRVRSMLLQENVRSRVRGKTYKTKTNGQEQRVSALHLVLKQHAPVDVVRTMVEIANGQGSLLRKPARPSQELPLHFAVRYRGCARKKIVGLLVEGFPDAVQIPSADGSLPLHIACSKRRRISVLRLLVGSNEDDDNAGNGGGGDDVRSTLSPDRLTPWEIVQKKSKFWQIIYRARARKLLKVHDEEFFDDNSSGDYEGDVAADETELAAGRDVAAPAEETAVEIFDGDVFHEAHESPEDLAGTPAAAAGNMVSPEDNSGTDGPKSERPGKGSGGGGGGFCVLCWDGPADHALIPCGHICLCKRCCRQNLPSLRRKCPVCSKVFERSLRVFHAGVVTAA